MNKEKIEELKKILYSKIDQLSTLIWDNFKTVHYDYFKINSWNLDEKIWKIRDILNSDNKKELEVLVMKKDIIKLTGDFLDKDIFEDINKEKKKLRRTRYIFLILIFLLTVIWIWIYWNLIYKMIQKINNIKPTYIVSSNSWSVSNISWSNLVSSNSWSVSTLSWSNLASSNSWSVSTLSWTNLVSSNSWSVSTLSWTNLVSSNSWSISTISWNKTKEKIETGSYIFWIFTKKEILSWWKLKGNIKVIKLIKDNTIKLKWFTTWYDFSKSTYSMLKYKWNYKMTWNNIFSWEYQIRWTLEKNIILWNVLSWNFILPKKKKILDKNENILKWKELQKYEKEKKLKCPYNWEIKVNVRALNLRQNNTQYSKKLWLLWRWTKLEVITCEKNIKADSWWYKVRILKDWKTWWVSTIWVWK